MEVKYLKYCEELTVDIQKAYEETNTPLEAEKLAAKFLGAQLRTAGELQIADLDARMKKSGVKAIRAAVYMEAAKSGDKKPSDVMLEAIVNMNELVSGEQKLFDEAEVWRDALQNYLGIFKDAHIYFRGIAKGAFNG